MRPKSHKEKTDEDKTLKRLFVFGYGLLLQKRVRKILRAAGWRLAVGVPLSLNSAVAVWGRKPSSQRGLAIARLRKKTAITIEDAFLRSVKTGRQGEPTIGIILDRTGIYFDTSSPSDLTTLLTSAESITAEETADAKRGISLLRSYGLSKYNANTNHYTSLPRKFILVVDQTRQDASVVLGSASADDFHKMLKAAIVENPDVPILVKTHPETIAGKRQGNLRAPVNDHRVVFLDHNISPWRLLAEAKSVYCVTSQLGLEAILSGHRPIVFGNPFYAGWGLSEDRNIATQQQGKLTPAQMFWACYLKYPLWYDPFFDRLSNFETTAHGLHERARSWQENCGNTIILGARLWKRGFLRRQFKGESSDLRFVDDPEKAVDLAKDSNARLMVWAGKETPELAETCLRNQVPLVRLEDGFLRSRGLGAELIPPVSLAVDDTGIYYDPSRESRLETLISQSSNIDGNAKTRASQVRQTYIAGGFSKYNLGGETTEITAAPGQKVILIVGQVEDDASVVKGAGEIRTNLELIKATSADFPNQFLIYKPHPDVEAGLRVGAVAKEELTDLVDIIATDADINDLLTRVDVVCTITSLAGFEALLRGKKVICYGMPFYAGWGLTNDMGQTNNRRHGGISLDGLVDAALIKYPRYWDPISGQPCTVEVILERFSAGEFGSQTGFGLRWLAKLQGLFASYSWMWR